MAVAIGAAKACLQIQQQIDDIAGNNVNALKIENFGALQWLTSSTNTTGFEGLQNQSPGGKNRQVRVWYWTNPRTAAGTDCTPDICTAGTTNSQKNAAMTLDLCRDVELTLDEQQFRDFCNSGEDTASNITKSGFARNQMTGVMNQLLAGISTDAVTYMNAHAGNFYSGIAGPKAICLFKTDNSPLHSGEGEIADDLEDILVSGQPAAIGQSMLRSYVRARDIVCCDQTGIDMTKRGSTFTYYSERRVQTITGVNSEFFVLAPGAMQLVSLVKWTGPYVDVRGENEAKTTAFLQVPGGGGFPIDVTIRRDFCGGNNDGRTVWKFTFSSTFDFWSMPADDEDVGSAFRSVNGILHYDATCCSPTCADVNS